MMTGEELAKAGRRLFGEDWRGPLGEKIGRHPVTVWRYQNMARVPPSVALAVRQLLAEQDALEKK
jgi:hypothetical protein